ncbi:MAG: glycosyltransferase [Planctomycetes bacterium]|nr:glycosyltransferase [Planctomycetota bacterium]
MIVSVVLPTKDRGPEIDLTLDALLRQDHRGFEVVIVDNLSCAEDAERLRARAAAAPQRLRYVREDRLGLNNARNRGIAASRGRILAFLDDDAIAPPSWVANIERAFAAHPAAWAIGSKVISRFTTPPPAWLDERLQLFLSGFDRGESIETLHYDDYPRGANMAFRREAFARCGPFRDCLDRKGDSLLSYGDIEMCYRVERSGHDVLYIPDAGVEHLIRGDRLTREWFRRRFYWQGRSIAVFERMHFGRLRVLRKLPYRLARCVFGGDEFSRQLYRGTIAAAAASLLRSRFE